MINDLKNNDKPKIQLTMKTKCMHQEISSKSNSEEVMIRKNTNEIN